MRTSASLRRRTTIRIDCGYGRMQHEATGDFMVCDQAVNTIGAGHFPRRQPGSLSTHEPSCCGIRARANQKHEQINGQRAPW